MPAVSAGVHIKFADNEHCHLRREKRESIPCAIYFSLRCLTNRSSALTNAPAGPSSQCHFFVIVVACRCVRCPLPVVQTRADSLNAAPALTLGAGSVQGAPSRFMRATGKPATTRPVVARDSDPERPHHRVLSYDNHSPRFKTASGWPDNSGPI